MAPVRIGLIGDFDPAVLAHRAIPSALQLAAAQTGVPVEWEWVPTMTLAEEIPPLLARFAALWCVPASPYVSTEGALRAIRYARQTPRPFLGTCGGFQHALLEYARGVWGMERAAHAEIDPTATEPVIAPLRCTLVERVDRVRLVPGSRLQAIYDADEAEEGYHCRYGLGSSYVPRLKDGPLRVSARDEAGEIRAVELEGHPFFIATLYQPEQAALAGQAHPLVGAYVRAAARFGGAA